MESFNTKVYLLDVWNKGTWSYRLLDKAALTSPGVVGWSGMLPKNISRWFLKSGKSPEFSFLMFNGKRLNRRAPWTPRDLSLSCITLVGAVWGIWLGTANLPLLSLHCHLMLYPSTSPWLSFQRKQMNLRENWYLYSQVGRSLAGKRKVSWGPLGPPVLPFAIEH